MYVEMAYQERRVENGRRSAGDRRKNSLSMISNYAEFSGQERRSGQNRRTAAERKI